MFNWSRRPSNSRYLLIYWRAAENKKLGHKLIFTGFQEQIENWLPALEAFVLLSLTEDLSMAILETIPLGIQTVASAVGRVPQLIESGENGILVPPGNAETLKHAIKKVYYGYNFTGTFLDKSSGED